MTFSTFHVRYFYNISTHILTRRMTKIGLIQLEKLIFQLTSSQGGWPSLQAQKIGEMYFNSHPHKEDDAGAKKERLMTDISTHILTRRMTWSLSKACILQWYFNSHPHKEDDRYCVSNFHCFIISTHILTRRMTAILNKNTLFKITFYINNRHFISIVDIFFHFHIYF